MSRPPREAEKQRDRHDLERQADLHRGAECDSDFQDQWQQRRMMKEFLAIDRMGIAAHDGIVSRGVFREVPIHISCQGEIGELIALGVFYAEGVHMHQDGEGDEEGEAR